MFFFPGICFLKAEEHSLPRVTVPPMLCRLMGVGGDPNAGPHFQRVHWENKQGGLTGTS